MIDPDIMTYRGFRASYFFNPLLCHFDEQANEDVLCGGFRCKLYDQEDLKCSNCLGEFDLGTGYDIPNVSDDTVQTAIRSYIDGLLPDLHDGNDPVEIETGMDIGPQM